MVLVLASISMSSLLWRCHHYCLTVRTSPNLTESSPEFPMLLCSLRPLSVHDFTTQNALPLWWWLQTVTWQDLDSQRRHTWERLSTWDGSLPVPLRDDSRYINWSGKPHAKCGQHRSWPRLLGCIWRGKSAEHQRASRFASWLWINVTSCLQFLLPPTLSQCNPVIP